MVINGGEPSLHPEFYKIVSNASNMCSVKIYTNGTMIDATKLPKNIELVIPIHGYECAHNRVTRNQESYKLTIETLQRLQENFIRYSIKFIINEDMINDEFDILKFLKVNCLSPCEVWLARLVESKVAMKNNYVVPNIKKVKEFLVETTKRLSGFYCVKYIDLAPCQILDDKIVDIDDESNSVFYFNDCNRNMIRTTYSKHLIANDNCVNCVIRELCDKIFSSYGVLEMQIDGNFKIVEE